MTKSCIFCGIEQTLLENDLAYARYDAFPVTDGHILICPKRHIADFFETTQDERLAILELLENSKSLLDSEKSPNGFNIGINSGIAAGQTIMHAHVHLIPRYDGDMEDPRGGIRWVIPDKADYWSGKR